MANRDMGFVAGLIADRLEKAAELEAENKVLKQALGILAEQCDLLRDCENHCEECKAGRIAGAIEIARILLEANNG